MCGINHRKIELIERCLSRINGEYANYVIICSGMKGGTCEENVKKAKHISLSNYKRVVKKRDQMIKYLKEKNNGMSEM